MNKIIEAVEAEAVRAQEFFERKQKDWFNDPNNALKNSIYIRALHEKNYAIKMLDIVKKVS